MDKIIAWKCPHCGSLWHSDDERHESACLERVKEETRRAVEYARQCEIARNKALFLARADAGIRALIDAGMDERSLKLYAHAIYWDHIAFDSENTEWEEKTYEAMVAEVKHD